MGFSSRLMHAWNVFVGRENVNSLDMGYGSSRRQDRPQISRRNDRSMITVVINRIAVDAASYDIEHVRVDDEGRYTDTINSGLNKCLTLEANIDQTGRAFMQDSVMSLLDEGCVVLVPIETSINPDTGTADILSMRVGKPIEWYPEYVKVNLYNEKTGQKEDVVVPKSTVAIIENPFYAVMNEPNSTLQRLIHKLNMLDAVDEQSSSGKLDLIIQLPYVIKSDARKAQAEARRKEIEEQLSGTKYGIAYTDGTEHITQLNRSIENNLLTQVQYLTTMLYSQLGMPQTIFDGTADEQTMLNYNSRTIEPILSSFANEMKRKFISKTGRTQGQSIKFFNDPFRLVPVSQLAEIADKMTRNEILTSNEVRSIMGYKPVNSQEANELRNKNLNPSVSEKTNTADDTSNLEEENLNQKNDGGSSK